MRLRKIFFSYKQPNLIQQKSYFRLRPKGGNKKKPFWVAILLESSSAISVSCMLAMLSVWKWRNFRIVHWIGLMGGLTSTLHFIHFRQCLIMFCGPQSKSYKFQIYLLFGKHMRWQVTGAIFCWRWKTAKDGVMFGFRYFCSLFWSWNTNEKASHLPRRV